MDTRCSPSRVLSSHAKDQRPDLFVYRLAARESPSSGEPLPVESKAGAMPLDHSSRGHQDEWLVPSLPELYQNYPEQFLPGRQATARSLGVQSKELLAQGEILEDQLLASAESADHPADEVSERREHGRHFIRKHETQPLQVIHSTTARSFDEGQPRERGVLTMDRPQLSNSDLKKH